MADRRMLAKAIIRSAHFMNLSKSIQFLYFQMIMEADDDGFISNPNLVVSFTRSTKKDLKALVDKRYIILFPSGIALIRHWLLHNTIRRDRYRETIYPEKNLVTVTKNRVYELVEGNVKADDTVPEKEDRKLLDFPGRFQSRDFDPDDDQQGEPSWLAKEVLRPDWTSEDE